MEKNNSNNNYYHIIGPITKEVRLLTSFQTNKNKFPLVKLKKKKREQRRRNRTALPMPVSQVYDVVFCVFFSSFSF